MTEPGCAVMPIFFFFLNPHLCFVRFRDSTRLLSLCLQLVVPLLRYVEKRIERREIPWGNRTLPAYVHRTGDKIRTFATLAGIR